MPKQYELKSPDAPASYPQKRKLAALGYKAAFTSPDMTMKMASDLITELAGTTTRVYTKTQKLTKIKPPPVPETAPEAPIAPVAPPVLPMTRPALSPMTEELVKTLNTLIERSKEPVTVDDLCEQLAAIGHWVVTKTAIHDAITAVARNPLSSRYTQFKRYVAADKLIPNRRGGRLPTWKLEFTGGRQVLVPKKQQTLPPIGTSGTKLDEIVPELNLFVDSLANTRGNVGRAHSLRNLLQIGVTGVRQERASTESILNDLVAKVADLSQKVLLITNERRSEPQPKVKDPETDESS